jgi:hypothetical protein
MGVPSFKAVTLIHELHYKQFLRKTSEPLLLNVYACIYSLVYKFGGAAKNQRKRSPLPGGKWY